MLHAQIDVQETPARRAAGERRQQLHDVATQLFVNDGFAGVSMRQLSDQLGLYPGSLYAHFESKQSLLFELIRDPLEDLLGDTEHRVGLARNAKQALREFIACHIEFQVHQRHRALLLNLELRCLEPGYRSEVDTLLRRYRQCLANILKTAPSKGPNGQQSISVSVQSILGMLFSVAHWFDDGQTLDASALTAQYHRMILGALQNYD